MDEQHEELAALNALGMLEGSEKHSLSGITARHKELKALAAEFEEVVADLGYAVQPITPPADLKSRIRAKVRASQAGKSAYSGGSGSPVFAILGWGVAAALAVTTTWLWNDRTHLNDRLSTLTQSEAAARQDLATSLAKSSDLDRSVSELEKEIRSLRERDALAQVQIATLQTSVAAYKEGVAVVVWDSEKQEGILKLEKMPPVEAGKDYQLWVVDPKKDTPVDAGVVKVDAQGFAKVDFKPLVDISEATKFALSVEKEGGVPKGEGPIILIGPN